MRKYQSTGGKNQKGDVFTNCIGKNELKEHYDVLIAGSGLYGSVLAHELSKAGKSVLVVEKRDHIGGNIYTDRQEGIDVHMYGAHIFHTSDKAIWDYVNALDEFADFINSPIALYHDEVYNLPFNMNTFSRMWNISTPQQAREIIERQRKEAGIEQPGNLEEKAISLVGTDIYEKLIRGYTQKQWGKPCSELPAFIISRLPVRFTYDNNYFTNTYQGIPKHGYTALAEKLLESADVLLNTDYLVCKNELEEKADQIVFTGMIDEYFDYCFGELEYRSLHFEHWVLDEENHQGNAVINYTDEETPWTRSIEHKHFLKTPSNKTVVTREYPESFARGKEPYYPINDEKNSALYKKYAAKASRLDKVHFGGRLGSYQYYDMHQVIAQALHDAAKLVKTDKKEGI